MKDQNRYVSVSDVARRLGVEPRRISDLFYARQLCDIRSPIVAGRRLIRESYIPEIEAVLRQQGYLTNRPAEETPQ